MMKECATDELKQVEGMVGSPQVQQEIACPNCNTSLPYLLPNQAVEDSAWALAKIVETLGVTKGPQVFFIFTI